ncbi:phosphatidylinositol N-acetylglucosaminyltransferase subunit Q-like [Bolinopsis microptera]|uniref:phosphatidylinositol N-acetylglucosaminyltransferase subunit Q-like n=1 Tax=Bolinopsis microptera TaxID=2820187 RepID=UPI00307A7C58
MKRRNVDSSSSESNTLVNDANCIFVCQNEHVLKKFKERYINTEPTSTDDDTAPTEPVDSPISKPTILDRLRRDIFPKMALENRILDISLGLLLFYYFWFYTDIRKFSDSLIDKAVLLANLLDHTISWLGEVPAGLKLNNELVQFLGLFFRYHIHLFKGYLDLISGYMPCILYTISLTCIPGITCFLSYTLSFSIILLLHVHCFYAYACNLYSAQLKALVSLGRLFAGVKYNPLRSRVDSVKTHGDQLILGTLLFSTLLFLFPTTLLYYCVFTLVNLALVLVQMCIVTAISVIRTCPIRDLVKVVSRDSDVMCDVMIQPLSGCHGDEGAGYQGNDGSESADGSPGNHGNVFIVTAVYKTLVSCLKRTSLGNHKLSLTKVKSKCLKGDVIKISF